METSDFKSTVEQFFADNPLRYLFVFVEPESASDCDTFVAVTRSLDVVAFDRMKVEGDVSAKDLAYWFNHTEEGQATAARLAAGIDEELRPGADAQARGSLLMMPGEPTVH